MVVKRGRQTRYVKDDQHQTVNGLRIHRRGKIDYYYCLLPDGSQKNFGSSRDKGDAIRRYRAWESDKAEETISFAQFVPNSDQKKITVQTVPLAQFWGRVETLLKEYPQLAAQKTGIKELHNLPEIKPFESVALAPMSSTAHTGSNMV